MTVKLHDRKRVLANGGYEVPIAKRIGNRKALTFRHQTFRPSDFETL